MRAPFRQFAWRRTSRWLQIVVAVAACGVLVQPTTASAQAPAQATAQATDQSPAPERWEVHFAPLYVWAAQMSGELSVRNVTTLVYMSFGDAAKNLSGIFTFHLEAGKHRWGVLADLGYVSLSTGTEVTVPGLQPSAPARVISGSFDLSNVVFEVGGSYLAVPNQRLSVIGGLRTYTMAPAISFTAASTLTPVDTSRTAAYGFAGLQYRPKLSDKWTLVTRGDIGGGTGLTWSAAAGLQFDFSRHGGILVGYRALGVNAGDVTQPATLPATGGSAGLGYEMTHRGPVVALNLRWGGK